MAYEHHEMRVILFSKEDAVFGTDVISDNDNLGNGSSSSVTYIEGDGLDTGDYSPYTDK